MTPEELAEQWLRHKQAEAAASAQRALVEAEILKRFPAREEGSTTTHLPNGLRIRTTGKLIYKADLPKLQVLCESWDESVRPFKTKVELDDSMLKAIRTDRPDVWRVLAPAITTKPAKTYIVVENLDGV